MDKKYQVFVSSTYQDLIEERQKVIEALISKNCFPVGMEYFPAANEEQFAVIKRLIDRCDYYILILGGRYGSIEPNTGKSYTQLEYEYALEKNIPVAAFYHNNIGKLASDKVEKTEEGLAKLQGFKILVQKKLCKSWSESYELAFKVNSTLDFMFENYPRTGWVKANEISSAEANKEILALKKENDELKALLAKSKEDIPTGIEKLKQGNDKISIRCSYVTAFGSVIETVETTWNKIISVVTPLMIDECSENDLSESLDSFLENELCVKKGIQGYSFYILDEDFQTIKIQLIALHIIQKSDRKKTAKDVNTYWTLTSYGYRLMMQLRALVK